MKKLILFAFLSTMMIACSSDDNVVNEFRPRNIEPIIIAQASAGGPMFPDNNPVYMYFRDLNEWEEFKENLWPASYLYPESIVNFDEYMTIVFRDRRWPEDTRIAEVSSVIEYENSIVIDIDVNEYGGYHAPAKPFVIFKIPTSNKEIIFE